MSRIITKQRVTWYTPLLLAGIALAEVAYHNPQTPSRPKDPEPRIGREEAYTPPEFAEGFALPEDTSTYAPDRVHASPNFNQRPEGYQIDAIIIHATQGSGVGAEEWLTNPKSRLSAHYLVMEGGEVVRLVNEENRAWHAYGFNDNSIGIEYAGYDNHPFTSQQLESGAGLINYLLEKYNLTREDVRPHSEMDPRGWKTDPGQENFERVLSALD